MTTYDVYLENQFYSEQYEAEYHFTITENNFGQEHDEDIKGITLTEDNWGAWGGPPPVPDPAFLRHQHLRKIQFETPQFKKPQGEPY